MIAYHAQLRTMFPKVLWETRKRARDMAVEYLINKRNVVTKTLQ